MARTKPGRRFELDREICLKWEKIKELTRYRGSLTSLIESHLDERADGLLTQLTGQERPIRAEFAGFQEKHGHEKRSRKSA